MKESTTNADPQNEKENTGKVELPKDLGISFANDVNDENFDEGDWKKLQCPTCNQTFYNDFRLSVHECPT